MFLAIDGDDSMESLLDRPKAFRWTYHLVSSSPERIVFTLPLKHLFFAALVALILGATILLNPEMRSDEPRLLVMFAGWGGVLMFVCLLVVVVTHSGQLTIDAASRSVNLRFKTPSAKTDWSRPFDAFSVVRTRQIKDGHGLHNHWRIELVADDGTCLMIGYGLIGAVGKKSRDRLSQLLAEMIEIPIEHAKKASTHRERRREAPSCAETPPS
jgi:hypothetical protein